MRRLKRQIQRPVKGRGRRGVSLVEVLMSLGLMSIGIAFIAGIFPLAALRTLRATNLTNSTILRFNAEAAIATVTDSSGTLKALIHNPDFDITDLDMNDDGTIDNDADGDGVPDIRLAHLKEHNGTNYIVDPVGYWEQVAVGGNPDFFGNNVPTPPVTRPIHQNSADPRTPLRFAGGTADLAAAKALTTLPDTFNDLGETVATGNTTTSVDLPLDIDLGSVSTSDAAYRVLLFNPTEDKSEARLIDSVTSSATGYTINWTGDLPFTEVGRVKVDVPTGRYTWLLSVRKRASGPANVDVVVFLNRSFDAGAEQVFEAEFRMINLDPTADDGDGSPGADGVDDDEDGTTDDRSEIGYPDTDDIQNNRVTIRWPDDDDSENDPFLQRGGYILDTKNCIWYRMQAVESETSDGTTFTARVVLDAAIKANNTEDLHNFGATDAGEDTDGSGALDQGGAITPRGVIAVYPLGLQ
jgi:hypothetical protein